MDALPASFQALRTVSSVRNRSIGLSALDPRKAKHSLRSRRVGGVHRYKRLDLFKKATNACRTSVLGKHFAQSKDRC